jgi:hypothetical protein
MSTPGNEPPAEQVATPTVSTAPIGGAVDPLRTSWWRWGALPDHLGRARTSTVILSVLFLAIFTLYLNVRPDVPDDPRRTTGGGSDVEAPLNPVIPTEPTDTPEPTEEPAPTTEPEETETPSETDTPTTGSTPSTSSPGTTDPTTEPTTEPSQPTETSEPSSPTDGTTSPGTSSPSTTG